MKAPDNLIRSLDEIVGELVTAYDEGDAYVNDLIKANDVNEADIRATLRFLRALCEAAPLWGNLKDNEGAASALRTQIEDLQATFRAMPRETLYLIFDPGTTGQDDHKFPPASDQTRALGRLRRT